MLERRSILVATVSAIVLMGCSSAPVITDYANEKPVFDLKDYFTGVVDGWGIFTDRSGKVVKRFLVTMNCTWNGDEGVLDEDFVYSDSTKQKRIWRMKKLAGGRYEGRADDVVGIGGGQQMGNAFRWGYTLNLPVDGKVYEVQFDDWMYQMDDKVVINKATMSKFGITLGELVVNFKKRN
jgi:opacity protein-like surface antigen